MSFKIELGHAVKDKVTRFTGVVTGRVEYITGCAQYFIQPSINKDGEFVAAQWIDEDRLEVITTTPIITLDVKRDGFGQAAPIK